MTQIWFTSDSHWGHKNIIEYCKRPFASVEAMDEALIKNWNSVVAKDDIVYHLGDFCFGGKERCAEILSKLNGVKILVKGNHDQHPNQWYRDCGFAEVYGNPVIIKDFLVLSHEPLPFVMNQMYVNLYGHVHDSWMFDTWGKNSACMCVERHGYKPVNLETIKNHLA